MTISTPVAVRRALCGQTSPQIVLAPVSTFPPDLDLRPQGPAFAAEV